MYCIFPIELQKEILGITFTPVGDHLLIYARQLVMWIVMIISPTPGGTGIAEFAFEGFLAVLWRLASYFRT